MENSNKLKKIYLLILAFTSGLTIMAVEISASRLIAPYFGTSTFIWTNVIGVIMVALALGYYFGGKYADSKPQLIKLLQLILIACIILLFIPFLAKPSYQVLVSTLSVFGSGTVLIFVGSLLMVSILFILPIILLGTVSPFIIKLLSEIDPNVGKDAGLVFSVSTIGSILGTFLPVLVFIPFLGTRKTILFFALLLLFVSLIGVLKRKYLAFLLLLIIPVFFLNLSSIKTNAAAIAEGESAYQYYQVEDRDNMRLLIINEGMALFSAMNLAENNVLTDYYFDYYNLTPYLNGNDNKQDIMVLGSAGGTISSQLHYFFHDKYDLNIDGIEIDQKIIDVARQYFDADNQSTDIYAADGRIFLDQTNKKYNTIIIDVYSNQLYISFHLTTQEFFTKVDDHLKDDGVVIMNMAAAGESELFYYITNTINTVFEHVYVFQANEFNYVVIGSQNEIDFNQLTELNTIPELNHLAEHAVNNYQELEFNSEYGILTDDHAPVEHLTDWMILEYLLN